MARDYKEATDKLFIDKHALDEEMVAQPQRFTDVAEQSALASSRRDGAKDRLKTVEASVEQRLRRKAEAASEKVTEAGIKAMVQTHAERQEAFGEWLEASTKAQQWEDLKDAFRDRSWMLRELANLYVAGYYTQNAAKGKVDKVEEHNYRINRAKLSEKRSSLSRVKVQDRGETG